MQVILIIEAGPRKGATIALEPDCPIEVGRRGRHFAIPEDSTLSAAHFLVQSYEGGRTTVRDLDTSNGTAVNGCQVVESELHEGDRVRAGESVFVVTVEKAEDGPIREINQLQSDPIDVLRGQTEPIYAILDSARDKDILGLLRESDDEYQSLYEGKSAETLAEYAPYLVRLSSDGLLMEALVQYGWGQSWGVYLTCMSPFRDLRQHLRQFLLVDVGGRPVYFRFYDPRVLRTYLRACLPINRPKFFGPISAFYMEAEGSSRLLCFERNGGKSNYVQDRPIGA